MRVIGTAHSENDLTTCAVMRYGADGAACAVERAVQQESQLDVYVNSILTMKLGCSASHIVELVVGRLFTEGLVSGADEIAAVTIRDEALSADVVLADRRADLARPEMHATPTCSTHNCTLNDYFGTDDALSPLAPIQWDVDWVFRVAREFAADKTNHARTQGVHSAYLATQEKTLVMREDIGRHNAFDKVVGWALMNGIDLSQCMLFTSGRVPTDMVTKAIRARIPLLVSKAVATDKTVRLAQEYGLALVCSAKPESIDIVNDPGFEPLGGASAQATVA